MSDLKAFALLCLLYFPCEAIYLTLAAPQYTSMFKRMQGLGPGQALTYATFPYGPLAYACYVPAWYLLCLRDSVLGRASPMTGLWKSSIFAIAVYGVYNLTNKVTFPGWPVSMLLQDFAWGVVCLTGVAAVLIYICCGRRSDASQRN